MGMGGNHKGSGGGQEGVGRNSLEDRTTSERGSEGDRISARTCMQVISTVDSRGTARDCATWSVHPKGCPLRRLEQNSSKRVSHINRTNSSGPPPSPLLTPS
eukprot:5342556-Pyramimonas_sp.AAC.1